MSTRVALAKRTERKERQHQSQDCRSSDQQKVGNLTGKKGTRPSRVAQNAKASNDPEITRDNIFEKIWLFEGAVEKSKQKCFVPTVTVKEEQVDVPTDDTRPRKDKSDRSNMKGSKGMKRVAKSKAKTINSNKAHQRSHADKVSQAQADIVTIEDGSSDGEATMSKGKESGGQDRTKVANEDVLESGDDFQLTKFDLIKMRRRRAAANTSHFSFDLRYLGRKTRSRITYSKDRTQDNETMLDTDADGDESSKDNSDTSDDDTYNPDNEDSDSSNGDNDNDSKKLECPKCESRFRDVNTFKTHMLSHFSEKSYQCKICMRAFANDISLKNHVESHEKENTYRCHRCSIGFPTRAKLDSHMTHFHPSYRRHKCPACKAGFNEKCDYETHMMEHIHEAAGKKQPEKAKGSAKVKMSSSTRNSAESTRESAPGNRTSKKSDKGSKFDKANSGKTSSASSRNSSFSGGVNSVDSESKQKTNNANANTQDGDTLRRGSVPQMGQSSDGQHPHKSQGISGRSESSLPVKKRFYKIEGDTLVISEKVEPPKQTRSDHLADKADSAVHTSERSLKAANDKSNKAKHGAIHDENWGRQTVVTPTKEQEQGAISSTAFTASKEAEQTSALKTNQNTEITGGSNAPMAGLSVTATKSDARPSLSLSKSTTSTETPPQAASTNDQLVLAGLFTAVRVAPSDGESASEMFSDEEEPEPVVTQQLLDHLDDITLKQLERKQNKRKDKAPKSTEQVEVPPRETENTKHQNKSTTKEAENTQQSDVNLALVDDSNKQEQNGQESTVEQSVIVDDLIQQNLILAQNVVDPLALEHTSLSPDDNSVPGQQITLPGATGEVVQIITHNPISLDGETYYILDADSGIVVETVGVEASVTTTVSSEIPHETNQENGNNEDANKEANGGDFVVHDAENTLGTTIAPNHNHKSVEGISQNILENNRTGCAEKDISELGDENKKGNIAKILTKVDTKKANIAEVIKELYETAPKEEKEKISTLLRPQNTSEETSNEMSESSKEESKETSPEDRSEGTGSRHRYSSPDSTQPAPHDYSSRSRDEDSRHLRRSASQERDRRGHRHRYEHNRRRSSRSRDSRSRSPLLGKSSFNRPRDSAHQYYVARPVYDRLQTFRRECESQRRSISPGRYRHDADRHHDFRYVREEDIYSENRRDRKYNRSRSRERERSRTKGRDRSLERNRGRERSRSRERTRGWTRERSRERERTRELYRGGWREERDRSRERHYSLSTERDTSDGRASKHSAESTAVKDGEESVKGETIQDTDLRRVRKAETDASPDKNEESEKANSNCNEVNKAVDTQNEHTTPSFEMSTSTGQESRISEADKLPRKQSLLASRTVSKETTTVVVSDLIQPVIEHQNSNLFYSATKNIQINTQKSIIDTAAVSSKSSGEEEEERPPISQWERTSIDLIRRNYHVVDSTVAEGKDNDATQRTCARNNSAETVSQSLSKDRNKTDERDNQPDNVGGDNDKQESSGMLTQESKMPGLKVTIQNTAQFISIRESPASPEQETDVLPGDHHWPRPHSVRQGTKRSMGPDTWTEQVAQKHLTDKEKNIELVTADKGPSTSPRNMKKDEINSSGAGSRSVTDLVTSAVPPPAGINSAANSSPPQLSATEILKDIYKTVTEIINIKSNQAPDKNRQMANPSPKKPADQNDSQKKLQLPSTEWQEKPSLDVTHDNKSGTSLTQTWPVLSPGATKPQNTRTPSQKAGAQKQNAANPEAEIPIDALVDLNMKKHARETEDTLLQSVSTNLEKGKSQISPMSEQKLKCLATVNKKRIRTQNPLADANGTKRVDPRIQSQEQRRFSYSSGQTLSATATDKTAEKIPDEPPKMIIPSPQKRKSADHDDSQKKLKLANTEEKKKHNLAANQHFPRDVTRDSIQGEFNLALKEILAQNKAVGKAPEVQKECKTTHGKEKETPQEKEAMEQPNEDAKEKSPTEKVLLEQRKQHFKEIEGSKETVFLAQETEETKKTEGPVEIDPLEKKNDANGKETQQTPAQQKQDAEETVLRKTASAEQETPDKEILRETEFLEQKRKQVPRRVEETMVNTDDTPHETRKKSREIVPASTADSQSSYREGVDHGHRKRTYSSSSSTGRSSTYSDKRESESVFRDTDVRHGSAIKETDSFYLASQQRIQTNTNSGSSWSSTPGKSYWTKHPVHDTRARESERKHTSTYATDTDNRPSVSERSGYRETRSPVKQKARAYRCNDCFKWFPDYFELNVHKVLFHGRGDKKVYNCHFCREEFRYHSEMQRHMLTVHNKATFFSLDCSKTFDREGQCQFQLGFCWYE